MTTNLNSAELEASNQEKFQLLNSFAVICDRLSLSEKEMEVITRQPHFQRLVDSSRGWSEETKIPLSENTFTRMIEFTLIAMHLNRMQVGFNWVHEPQTAFSGKSAWGVIESTNGGLRRVLEVLSAQPQDQLTPKA